MEKKLKISENTYYYTYGKNYNLLLISDIIKNTFLNYNIYISNIYGYEYPKCIIFKFDIWIHNKKCYKFLHYIIKFLKSLLILKYNKNIEFNIKISKNLLNDDKLLTEYLKTEINSNKQLLRVIKNLL